MPVVNRFAPAVSGPIVIRPTRRGFRQDPPLQVQVELGEHEAGGEALAERIAKRIRDTLLVATTIALVPYGTLPRSDYKSKLVDWSDACSDSPSPLEGEGGFGAAGRGGQPRLAARPRRPAPHQSAPRTPLPQGEKRGTR